jgi:ABC-type glycerol-3-phosphate transport system substrate-binding protein
MMFYRTDILSQLSCKPPETWDDFLATLAVLQRNNLQAGVGSNDMNMFATLLMQNGGSLYTKDKKNLNLDDETSIKTFLQWCGFFTDYKMPVTADYYNRFRVGIMPIIVTNYSMYITLKVAAPEIAGKWKMVGIPGVKTEDGSINNSQTSTGTGCSILAGSKNKCGAWELLKWWTSAPTQSAYSEQVETILGVSGRVTTSNIEALRLMSWDDDAGLEISKQLNKINDIPEIPGGYYVSRVITQAYWNVVSNGQDARDTLSKWSDIAKAEIQRKRSQYNLDS